MYNIYIYISIYINIYIRDNVLTMQRNSTNSGSNSGSEIIVTLTLMVDSALVGDGTYAPLLYTDALPKKTTRSR